MLKGQLSIPNFEEPSSYNHKYIQLEHGTYHYVDQGSESAKTIVFLHGFPESWFFWKYQLQHFSSLGYRTIAFSMPGYGETKVPNDLKYYSHRSIASDLKHILADKLKIESPIIIGHDWGSMTTWELAYQYPDWIDRIASISVPYIPPQKTYVPLREKAEKTPVLGYQVALAESDNKLLDNHLDIFLKGFWAKSNAASFERITVPIGVSFLDHFQKFEYGDFIIDEKMVSYLFEQFRIQGTEGPCNWYRTSKVNFDEDQKKKDYDIKVKALTILGKLDFLTQFEKEGLPYVHNLTKEYIEDGGHWIQYTHHELVNQSISNFIKS